MPTSASTFAAQLVDALDNARPRCGAKFDDEPNACGNPAGRADVVCARSHHEPATLCPACAARPMWCAACYEEGHPTVWIVEVRTEVSA